MLSYLFPIFSQGNRGVLANEIEKEIMLNKIPVNISNRYFFVASDMACMQCMDKAVSALEHNDKKNNILIYFTTSKKKIRLNNTVFKESILENNFYVVHNILFYEAISKMTREIKGPYLLTFGSDGHLSIVSTLAN